MFIRVTLPLIAPGLLAGFCLVFLTAVTELTATLVLAPIGVETLATQFWAYQSEVAYGAAAPYALVIVALAVIPGAFLGLWFTGSAGPDHCRGPGARARPSAGASFCARLRGRPRSWAKLVSAGPRSVRPRPPLPSKLATYGA